MVDVSARLTPIEAANLLAGHAAGYATAFLDGRHDAEELGRNADRLLCEMLAIPSSANGVLDPVRLLAIAMMHTARATGEARQDRWQQVMGSLVELVRAESRALVPAQRMAGDEQ